MILDRLVIAGLTWTGRTLMGVMGAKLSRARTADRDRDASPKRDATAGQRAERESAPAETQQVVGPDQDMLQSLNLDDSMGFEDRR
jgi:hypothetical protein